MNIHEVLKMLPHRFPFLLIDKVLECTPDESIKAVKNVTVNEPCFQGHFPEFPVFPGVLILEAMAQAAGILTFKSIGKYPSEDVLFLFVGIDKARFKRQVVPGDTLVFNAKILRKAKRDIWKFEVEALVDDEVACSAVLMGAVRERTE